MTKVTKWYAKGGNIAKCGPFKSQEEATQAMRLVPFKKYWTGRTSHDYGENAIFPDNIFVWPETTES